MDELVPHFLEEDTQLIKDVFHWVVRFDANASHSVRAAFWSRKLNTNASEAVVVACLAHDVEGSFPIGRVIPTKDGQEDWTNEKYLAWHAHRSAKLVRDFLNQKGVPSPLRERIIQLVANHEVGGDEEETLVMEADSLAFIEMHAQLFQDWIPSDDSNEKVKAKLGMMKDRLKTQQARELAFPLYEKALQALNSYLEEE